MFGQANSGLLEGGDISISFFCLGHIFVQRIGFVSVCFSGCYITICTSFIERWLLHFPFSPLSTFPPSELVCDIFNIYLIFRELL